MTADGFERDVRSAAAEWVFIREVETVDKTEHAVKMRLHVDTDCFVQVYANTQKEPVSYTLILNRYRILGRDCEGGTWHRHPRTAPDQHDFSPEGQRTVSLAEFLSEAQHVLQEEGLL